MTSDNIVQLHPEQAKRDALFHRICDAMEEHETGVGLSACAMAIGFTLARARERGMTKERTAELLDQLVAQIRTFLP